jgi:hypothetical protein
MVHGSPVGPYGDAFPARIPFDGDTRRAHHLVCGDIQGHVVRGELAMKLSLWQKRPDLPAVPVVHRDAGVPVGEIVMPSTTPLPPGQRGEASRPVHADGHRTTGLQRLTQRYPHHRRVGCQRVQRLDDNTVYRHTRDPLVRVLVRAQALEGRRTVHRFPHRPGAVGPERVQMQVEPQRVERLRCMVPVVQAQPAGEHVVTLVQPCFDGVMHLLANLCRVRCRNHGE